MAGLTAGFVALLYLAASPPSPAPAGTPVQAADAAAATTLGVEGCVAQALVTNAKIEEAAAKVRFFKARLHELDVMVYPKIAATAFLAPMYTVRGDGFTREPQIHYKSLRNWGPYANFEARLIQPLSSFGRSTAAKNAARERAGAEAAQLEQVMQQVARETRKLYYLRLYALSMLPAMRNAQQLVQRATAQAAAMHRGGTGDVTQVDLARLEYADAELERRLGEAEVGEQLALAALKQAMGLQDTDPLEQRDATLPIPTAKELAVHDEPLSALLTTAAINRPEWSQLRHGMLAAEHWARAERLAMLPQLVFVGQFNASYTPTRDRDPNPWHYDIYNRLNGGFALALRFDLDPAQALAKARQATYTGQQVAALHRFAATGIPLEVKAAHESLVQLRAAMASTARGTAATRRWMKFAAAALAAGTGEARDLLDGTATYLQAKQTQMSTVQAYYGKLAELTYAVGRGRHATPHP